MLNRVLLLFLSVFSVRAAAEPTLQQAAMEFSKTCVGNETFPNCRDYCGDGGVVNFCAFRNAQLAQAAELVAPTEVVELQRKLIALNAPTEQTYGIMFPKLVIPEIKPNSFGTSGLTPDVGALATDAAIRIVEALARLIVDRAQRESAAFVLAEIYRGLCKSDLRGWFISTCSLAGADGDLSAYGSGGPTLQLLRAALEADLRAVPGRSAATLVQNLYRLDLGQRLLTDGGVAPIPAELGPAIERAVEETLVGVWFFDAIEPSTRVIDEANKRLLADAAGRNDGVYAPFSQWAACALGFPANFRRLEGRMPDAGVAVGESESRTRASIAGAIANSEPCLSMITNRSDFPKLNALAALAPVLTLDGAAAAAENLKIAVRQANDLREPRVTFPDGGVDFDESARKHRVNQLVATTRISEAGFELGRVAVSVAGSICSTVDERWKGVCSYPDQLAKLRQVMWKARDVLGIARAVIEEDWTGAVVKTTRFVTAVCGTEKGCTDNQLRLGPELNSALALISAKDADETAKLLDALASPIGEWKGKQQPNRFTVSITSHASLAGGIEWRIGQTGVFRELGNGIYGAGPTLALPVGVEFAWGCYKQTSLQLLLSLVDPAGFLQYDAARDGRLPAASLLTILAPGLHLRWALGSSPFGVGLFGVVRPGLRRWESRLDAPGATAIQFGIEFSVDVTLFRLWRHDP